MTYQSINGLKNKTWRDYTDEIGITYEWSKHTTPEVNGCAERRNKIVLEKAFAMLHVANLTRRFWPQAVEAAAFLANRTLSKKLKTTPYQKLWKNVQTQRC